MADRRDATAKRLEVFADITCPFTHVGLKRVVEHVAEMQSPIASPSSTRLTAEANAAVREDYALGLRRRVTGSPHFWVGEDDFFCPSLDLGHDAEGHLVARLDADGLARFFARIDE